MSIPGPLLITNRPGLARQVAELAPATAVTVAAPTAVTVTAWASAPAVLIDALVLPELRRRALPPVRHAWVLTDAPPTADLFEDAVDLRAERVVELPTGSAWLADALRAAGRRAPVVAVLGIEPDMVEQATLVAAALAMASLQRDEQVALVGLHRDQTVAERLAAVCTDTPTADPDRRATLTVLTRSQQPATNVDLARILTDLASGQDLVVLDIPAPPDPASQLPLTHADHVIVVTTPDHREHPALAALTAPGTGTADRVRVAVLTTNPALAAGWGHPITPPSGETSRWITTAAFARDCIAVLTAPGPVGRP